MKAERQADFVMSLNPDERLFVARMAQRSFVDQRLIALAVPAAKADRDLMHALMNTTLSMFLIEAGRFRPRTECSGSLEGSGGSSVSDPRSPANRPG